MSKRKVLVMLTVFLALTGCTRNKSWNQPEAAASPPQTFAVVTGTIWDTILEKNIPGAKQAYFNSVSETVMAVKQGKADATLSSVALAGKFNIMYPELELLYPPIFQYDSAFIFDKDNNALRESFNNFLREIHNNGIYADMEERWINTLGPPEMPEIGRNAKNGKITFATAGDNDVFAFMQKGKPAGFEIELAYRFALYMEMELEIQLMDFSTLIPAIRSGRADFGGNGIAVTDERRQLVDFSDTVYADGLLVTVRKEGEKR
jgi:polar amino acid transport system substrate-binding protein